MVPWYSTRGLSLREGSPEFMLKVKCFFKLNRFPNVSSMHFQPWLGKLPMKNIFQVKWTPSSM